MRAPSSTLVPSSENAAASALFFYELTATHGDLHRILDRYGASSLVDTLYVMDAILRAWIIPVYMDAIADADELGASRVVDMLLTLPSSSRWMQYLAIRD